MLNFDGEAIVVIECQSCRARNRVPAARLTDASHCGQCKAKLTPAAAPLLIANEAEFDDLVRDARMPVLIDFWAGWCGPCRAVAPEIDRLAADRSGQVIVAKLDTERVPSIAARFGIRGIPTFVLFDQGAERARTSGAMPADALASQLGL
jgi:thioredoxin 2